MSRIADQKCRYCRREQTKLYLKGERCYTDKCPVIRRQSVPGKNVAYTGHLSNYGLQLREKQKVRRTFGVTETQLKNIYAQAAKAGGDKGLNMLQLLERRLDNVVYLLGLAPSRNAARQLVNHGFITVNGKKIDIASYTVKVSDKIKLTGKRESVGAAEIKTPSWLKKADKGGEMLSIPTRDMMDKDFKEYMIIEFYSR